MVQLVAGLGRRRRYFARLVGNSKRNDTPDCATGANIFGRRHDCCGRAPLGSAREVVVLIDRSKHLRSLFHHCSTT